MRIFFSVGEPSGDVHGANLIHALRQIQPGVECVGFGGERMRTAGCDLHYPLAQLSVMGLSGVVTHAATFTKLLSQADRHFRQHRPDALVLIDYPGFNWWMARRAHAHGIPVYYFVPPQLWAWAGWRVHKMRRFVDHVLCTLPFEPAWYRQRHVQAHYVGHPFFDDLPEQRLDEAFLAEQRSGLPLASLGGAASAPSQGPIIGLLPGSRNGEIDRNWSMLYQAAARIHQARPDARFRVACFKPHQQQVIEEHLRGQPPLPLQTHVGRTPEIIEMSTACVAVSGSVSLELLWRRKPTVVVYRVNALYRRLSRVLVKAPYICLVNLLAQKELYPEFLTDRCEGVAVAEKVLTWLNDAAAYRILQAELTALRDRVAESGACARTARYIVQTLDARRRVAA